MADDDIEDDDNDTEDEALPALLLIATGSSLRAEEVDRPLAYYLRQQIESALLERGETTAVRVVCDFRWIQDESFQRLPTISLGGPGVSVLAHRWLDDVPLVLAVDEEYYVQLAPTHSPPLASIWGMNNAHTQLAVAVFLKRYLDGYLTACAKHFADA
jgi:hypothetical protein